ncbi:DegT/DnrJ/EryC1/StrS family aminotransferase [Natronobacterium gregoryi]|uniref:DegT/DnrJ/EryC1/StrS family aminotransferase n=2 Tax=Natronobacterium gregoryi TaxID=44930 RepID=L0ALT0_NATGS|nr:DegT/DnrJ/EryC1/StrS family aminotransferase [Natronobacterium gregoryi]AFZ74112.1 putative PLP-dependent enzyme possibly involved in cell wall biogenesis [Natronobacterium gregoryi SP2]ELY63848.1 Glutamine--scyllo-inositol transaminase [Natronobacterium gregoryi SP2]PLK18711.1 DegT/DnrJ/EryC1/StrS family aminotransferase [Natronobacterium gregoryi SP2]SFJ66856.1 dTDP-4-amino-4,6-dideoxygalactose transaminase [Natronobacterium gregoryi]
MTDTSYNTETEFESDAEPEQGGVSVANPSIDDATIDRVGELLEQGTLADGPVVRTFEEEFAAYCGADRAVATSNGTTALHAALEALGVEDGDAVITSPFSFVASANAIRLAGGKPVFADVDPETYALDPEAVEAVLQEREDVVGLLPVHLYGLPAEMPTLCDLADDHDLFVLEDACQAHGAEVEGERVGSFGDAACFSFYPTKNMTTGEGGAITTDRDDIADRVEQYVNHGRAETGTGGYDHVSLGHNYRLPSPAAAIGRRQLERLPAFNEARRENAAYYDERLSALPVETPTEPSGYRHVYHQYTIRADDRDALASTLADRGVGTAVYYETPIHRQPAYESVSTAAPRFPEAERAAETVLSVPVHPALSAGDRRTVAEAIHDHYT